jgi:hypothetical protein
MFMATCLIERVLESVRSKVTMRLCLLLLLPGIAAETISSDCERLQLQNLLSYTQEEAPRDLSDLVSSV